MSWSDLDLTFDLAIVTLAYKVLFSPMVSGWAGGRKKFVQAVSRKP